jgi:spermidine/putrescine transport system permease protein
MGKTLAVRSPERTELTDAEKGRLWRDRLLNFSGSRLIWLVSIAGFIFLWAPIILLIIFSFNDSRTVNEWRGFTLRWYSNIFNNVIGTEARFSTSLMLESLGNSLIVGVAATIIATVIGTMVALSLVRGTYPGKRIIDSVLFMPLVIPEITQGVSLAMFFAITFEFMKESLGITARNGFPTIIIGHVVFNISYVVVVVRARLADMNPRLEEAANDLGANPWQTFWRITFPQIVPGIIAGALLAFTLSLDDYVMTFFTSGPGTTTLTVFVYGLLKTSVSPEINALSTLIMVVSIIMIAISQGAQRRAR